MTTLCVELKRCYAHSIPTRLLLSLLVVGRAEEGPLTTGRSLSLNYYSILCDLFALLALSCNGQLMSQSMPTLLKSSIPCAPEIIKTIMCRLPGIWTAVTGAFDSTLPHNSHLLNKEVQERRMRTWRTNTSQIPKPFTSFIIIPQLAQLLTISRSPKRLLVVLSPILCSPTEYLPRPLWHFASPTSHHYRPQLMKHQKHMAWLTYGWLLPITFAVSTRQCKPLLSPRGCRFGSRFKSNSQAITTSSHWSLPKAFLLLTSRFLLLASCFLLLASCFSTLTTASQWGYDFAIISQTEQSDWPSSGLTGMFWDVNFPMYVYHLTGHNVVQVCLIFCLLRSDIFLAYVQCLNATVDNMYALKCAIQNNGTCVGEVIPLCYIRSPAHTIPHFRKEANPWLTLHTSYESSNEFWLNKYWSKEFFYTLSLST